MMTCSVDIGKNAIDQNFKRITDQIFKLLPTREEGQEWLPQLQNIIIEVRGLCSLFYDHPDLLRLLSKLEGLKTLQTQEEFLLFRTTIFECLSILSKLNSCQG